MTSTDISNRRKVRRRETLESFWQAVEPILQSVFDSPEVPPKDLDYKAFSSVYTKCYDYTTSPQTMEVRELQATAEGSPSISNQPASEPGSAAALVLPPPSYRRIDEFFAERAKIIYDNSPGPTTSFLDLARYVLVQFAQFSGATSITSRLLRYLERYVINQLIYEGHGWSTVGIQSNNTLKKMTQKQVLERDRKLERWGYKKDADNNLGTRQDVESWAEAGSSLDRIVPIKSLAFRRLRVAFLEPLLADQGRMVLAIGELLDPNKYQEVEVFDKEKLILGLRDVFRGCGIAPDNSLRVKLELYEAKDAPS
ncbi:hypothetical protein F5876DRAFT_79393 [Lentinula aff. lateritia]|uniref:Uncharacterized protein n=1 Tax=Lentinula aff. lateritia TaxID=2804960 RepID=A0ACC1TSQ2_9AGAR|nr:hypothetical protein F5876DRAFT_79393 [Lentinula aff. lateritia]